MTRIPWRVHVDLLQAPKGYEEILAEMEYMRVGLIGAGLAGLNCARLLHENNVDFEIFEGATDIGGRVRTDEFEGFLLDRGFQVLLPNYPELTRTIAVQNLNLGSFKAGARVFDGSKYETVADPRRDFLAGIKSLSASFVTTRDLYLLYKLSKLTELPPQTQTTDEFLASFGFSKGMIENFFRPFFGGVYLDLALTPPAPYFMFLFRLFSSAKVGLPQKGMQAIPNEIARKLPREKIHLAQNVTEITERTIITDRGQKHTFDAVVVATDPWTRKKLLPQLAPDVSPFATTTLYYAAPATSDREPFLRLQGAALLNQQRYINTVAILNHAQPSYAPKGYDLISVNVVGRADEMLERKVFDELHQWFGSQAKHFRLLRVYRIAHALPAKKTASLRGKSPWLQVIGDDRESPSINGALTSGRIAAQNILRSEVEHG